MRAIALAAILATILATTLAISACTYNPPAPERSFPQAATATINAPYAKVWDKALSVLAGYPIAVANKESGVITTGAKPVRLTDAQADCGNIWGLPYVKDKRTTTSVVYSVQLSPSGESTMVTANTTISGNFVSHAGASSLTLNCRSLGDLEAALLRRLSQ